MAEERPARVLVTGATGFIGTSLVALLVRNGWEVHTLTRSRPAPGDDRARQHSCGGGMEEIARAVEQARPELVFHLASHFLPQHTPADVLPLIESNVLFGAQLLEAMASWGCTRLVTAGTSWQHYANEDYNPVCLYAATKQAFADIARYYAEAAGVVVTTLALFDTYGPGDSRPKLFNLLRRASREGTALALSPGDQLLDLVYVDDVTEAFRLAALRLLRGEAATREEFAVSSGRPLALRTVVETWCRLSGSAVTLRWGERPYRPREVMVPWNRGATLPGWHPRIGLEEGILRMEAGQRNASAGTTGKKLL